MTTRTGIVIRDARVRRILRRLQARMDDMRPAARVIGEIVVESVQRNFEAGGRPAPWKPLSETTKTRRRAKGKWPGQILVVHGVSGGLMGAVNYRAGTDRVTIGTKKAYAAVHQFGARQGEFGAVMARVKSHFRKIRGKRVRVKTHTRHQELPWGDIPARPFLLVQDEDWAEIRRSLAELLLDAT